MPQSQRCSPICRPTVDSEKPATAIAAATSTNAKPVLCQSTAIRDVASAGGGDWP